MIFATDFMKTKSIVVVVYSQTLFCFAA